MNRNGSLVSASLDGTVIVSVIALSNILHASCSLPEEYRNHTEGLLGKKQAGPFLWGSSHGRSSDPQVPSGPPPIGCGGCFLFSASLEQSPVGTEWQGRTGTSSPTFEAHFLSS